MLPNGSMIRRAAVLGSTLLVLGLPGGVRAPAGPPFLVQLRPGAAPQAISVLEAAGARSVSPAIRLWRLPVRTSAAALRRLRALRALAFAEPERRYAVAATTASPDPLVSEEWWRAAVRVDGLTPPGPGVPVTLVDTGVSFQHPEFAGRPNLVPLDKQEPAPLGGVHGTAVASVVGAPVNGVGLEGIYPEAVLRSYDASLGDGTRLPSGEIAAGIVTAARAGRSVINLSVGGNNPDPAIAAAVVEAVRTGSLVVAASGNSAEDGNWLSYPGASPHVLTVGATDRNDTVASFSTRSQWVDIAAPGVDIPVASALDNSWQPESGTSFSSPIVAGAAAWLWTVRPQLDASQVAAILRASARDVGPRGYDTATGYGILDMTAALAAPTPVRDLPEPNEIAVDAVPLTSPALPSATTTGRVAAYEDPRDVVRVWAPRGRRLTVSATPGVSVALFGDSLAASSRIAAGTSSLSFTNVRRSRSLYLVVTPARGARESAYRLTVAVR